jgi:catechol 2,3-dioxygenase-like lactoylglutathione lyase family enzyme/ketosteroid isomerase-like protein
MTTTNIDAMLAWYRDVLGMSLVHRTASATGPHDAAQILKAAWVTNDEANHRLAFVELPGLVADPDRARHKRLQHSAFEYRNLDDLLGSYARLKPLGILPVLCTDSGAHYYEDPDRNSVELNVDNYGDSWTSSEICGTRRSSRKIRWTSMSTLTGFWPLAKPEHRHRRCTSVPGRANLLPRNHTILVFFSKENRPDAGTTTCARTRFYDHRYTSNMLSSNVAQARRYLEAVAAGESFDKVFDFYAPDVVIQEFPNRIAPQGRVRRAADIRAAYEQGRKILQSQSYKVQRVVQTGDEVAVELEWTGKLAVPVMGLPAGIEMKAFVAMFLTFRDGKIISQRNYDCYPPFAAETESTPR